MCVNNNVGFKIVCRKDSLYGVHFIVDDQIYITNDIQVAYDSHKEYLHNKYIEDRNNKIQKIINK